MSPYEQIARMHKVAALVDSLWARAEDGDRTDPQFPWTVGEKPAAWWAEQAWLARVNVASETSRSQVVIGLCKRVNAERRGRTEPCDECQGEGTYGQRFGGSGEPEWDGEVDCRDCRTTGKAQCECCREETASVVVPHGFYGSACAEQRYPEIARHARMTLDPFVGLQGGGDRVSPAASQAAELHGSRATRRAKVVGS